MSWVGREGTGTRTSRPYTPSLTFTTRQSGARSSHKRCSFSVFVEVLLKNSMPCAYCSALLLELGFKRISFFLDGEIVSMTREDFERLVEAGLPKSYE